MAADEELDDLFEIIQEAYPNPELKSLNLNGNQLFDKGLRAVGLFIVRPENSKIDTVDVSDNHVQEQGIESLCAQIESHDLNILKLNLNTNPICDLGAQIIADFLTRNRTLVSLRLTNTVIDCDGAVALGNALKVNNTLIALDIDLNPFLFFNHDPAGKFGLAAGINENTSLEILTLGNALTTRLDFCWYLVQIEDVKNPRNRKTKLAMPNKADYEHLSVNYILEEWRRCHEDGFPLIQITPEHMKRIHNATKRESDDDVENENLEIECLERIKQFMEHSREEGGPKTLKRARIMIIGSPKSGKTSLMQAIIAGQCAHPGPETVALQSRTEAINGVTCSVYDFSGDASYKSLSTFFSSPRTIIIIAVNLLTYSKRVKGRYGYEESVQQWIDMVQSYNPGASFIIVGTHADVLPGKNEKEINKQKFKKLQHIEKSFQNREDKIQQTYMYQINKSQSEEEYLLELMQGGSARSSTLLGLDLNVIDPNSIVVGKYDLAKTNAPVPLGKQLGGRNRGQFGATSLEIAMKSFQPKRREDKLKDKIGARPRLSESVHAIGSKIGYGVETLRSSLVKILQNPREYRASIELPANYYVLALKLQNDIAPEHPIISFKELSDKLGDLVTAADMETALETLHNTGQLLWFKNNDDLSDTVFMRPEWVVDMVRAIIRHDMYTSDEGLKSLRPADGQTQEQLDAKIERFKQTAILDVSMLWGFKEWSKQPTRHLQKMLFLLEQLELVCFMPDLRYNAKDDIQEVEVLVPFYLQTKIHGNIRTTPLPKVPESLGALFRYRAQDLTFTKEKYKLVDGNHVQLQYVFSNVYPEGLLMRFITIIAPYVELQVESMSECALLAKDPAGSDIYIEVKEDYEVAPGNVLPGALFMTAVKSVSKDKFSFWNTLNVLSSELEQLLKFYPGVTVGVFTAILHSRLGMLIAPREACEAMQCELLSSKEGEIASDAIHCAVGDENVPLTWLLPEVTMEFDFRGMIKDRDAGMKGDRDLFDTPIPQNVKMPPLVVHKSFFGKLMAKVRNFKDQLELKPLIKERNSRLRVIYVALRKLLERILRDICGSTADGVFVRGWRQYFDFLRTKNIIGFEEIWAEIYEVQLVSRLLFGETQIWLIPSMLRNIVGIYAQLLSMLFLSRMEGMVALGEDGTLPPGRRKKKPARQKDGRMAFVPSLFSTSNAA